ncbi:MAG: hypothetical protein ABFR90_00890 [Planctomycetota bacterium]
MMTRYFHFIYFISLLTFLPACSGNYQQEASVDAKPQVASQDTAVEPAEETKPAEEAEKAASQDNSEVQKKLEFARSYLELAQKGVAGYSQTVAICRSVIKDYPGTEYECQAKEILAQVPEDLRSQFHITDEELEL